MLSLAAAASASAAILAQSPPDLAARIASLSSLDYPTRMNAARLVRREPAALAVAALRQAVSGHADEYVRYRAFILLTAFDDPGTAPLVRTLLTDRNDRLREAAYKWLERHPDRSMAPALLASLKSESNEFVRPALIGALAAVDESADVQRALVVEANRGVDFFRSAVLDALGRHRADYAIETIVAVANLDGPLQDDAILALGRIGGERARAALAAHASAPPPVMPIVHAARCLAGDPCDGAVAAIVEAGRTGGRSPVMVAAMTALSALASEGREAGTAALVTLGQAGGAVRDESALALAAAAVRNPGHVIAWLAAAPEAAQSAALELMTVGFEDLEEDFGKEQFFAAARASYWAAAEGSAGRTLAATLIQTLDF